MADSSPLEIDVQPGIFKTGTSQVARGRYTDCNKVRFRNGKPEKWAGWKKLVSSSLNGIARGSYGWVDSIGKTLLAAGTAVKAYSIDDTLNDITPFRSTGSLGNNPFTTVNLSPIVTVAHTAHGNSVGAHVHFAGSATFNGITPNGEFVVLAVVNNNSYTFTYSGNANASSSGGGAGVTFSYEINPGLANQAEGLGAGVGPVGVGFVGTPRTPGGGVTLDLRTWFFARYGDELMMCPSGDTIYLWNEPNGDPRGLIVTGAPTAVRAMFVTAERFLIALGTNLGRMVMQWPDRDNINNWNPDITDTANGRRLQYGNELVAGTVTGDKVNVFWSDTAFYGMQYSGGEFIYDTPVISTEAGLIGPCAFAETPVGVVWMSSRDFFIYSGQIGYVPNRLDIRDWFFDSLDTSKGSKITCGYDQQNNSIIWSVCFSGENEPGHYIEVALDDFSWDVGKWDAGGNRTAITNFGAATGSLLMIGDDAGGGNGFVYTHNVGTDADGKSMPWFLQRAIIAIADGDQDSEVEYYEPDYERQIGTVTLEVRSLERPMVDWYLQDEFFSIPQGTVLLHLNPVVGGRYVQTIESGNSIGGDWRSGISKLWVAPGGQAEA